MPPALQYGQRYAAHRTRVDWSGLAIELLSTADLRGREFVFDGPAHFICFGLSGRRTESVVEVDGEPATPFLDVVDRFHVVPAGATFRGFSAPATPQRFVQIYLDPRVGALHPDLDLRDLAPRLAANHAPLTATARKLEEAAVMPAAHGRLYGEMLGCVLGLELLRWQNGAKCVAAPKRGGLSPHHLRSVMTYMDENLDQDIALVTLATLVGVTPWHFCRAFKQSVGSPPHRWLLHRRVARARELLAKGSMSLTDVAFAVGFGGSSQFARAFRQIAGFSPSEYRRRFDEPDDPKAGSRRTAA